MDLLNHCHGQCRLGVPWSHSMGRDPRARPRVADLQIPSHGSTARFHEWPVPTNASPDHVQARVLSEDCDLVGLVSNGRTAHRLGIKSVRGVNIFRAVFFKGCLRRIAQTWLIQNARLTHGIADMISRDQLGVRLVKLGLARRAVPAAQRELLTLRAPQCATVTLDIALSR